MCMDYAKRMRNLRKSKISSLHIAVCLDYIYDHLHTHITAEQLAKLTGLNISYLSRLFKKETGQTISNYIRDKKIETAKNMLLYSDFSPSEIASILAFPSQSYFTEVFRKTTGVTPRKYQESFYEQLPLENNTTTICAYLVLYWICTFYIVSLFQGGTYVCIIIYRTTKCISLF